MSALLIPGAGLVQDDSVNLLIPGGGIVLAQATGATSLPIQYQGVVGTAAWFQGVQVTSLHFNGAQLWP